MEETQAVKSTSDDSGEDFYEMIEAPKFVDFTVPDPYIPDDRYWFCSRVGCEEKHPEEMDSDVVYKNFVMRVMAARSPNVRLQRGRRNLKCPLTAPPKSSRPRVARLALISSISKRIVDARVKSRPPTTKPSTTQAHAKAMTTPRNRKLNSNTKSFLIVKNSKTSSAKEPKTTTVAKALVFQSPKRDRKKKSSKEMNTPVKTLCAAMKKLEITSGKKNVLGDGQSLPQDVVRKKFRGREVKSRVLDSLGTHGCKLQDAKSARVLKRSKEKNLKPPLPDRVAKEIVDDDASNMDIDEKSRHVSIQGCSMSTSAKSKEGNQDELSRSEDSDSFTEDSSETSILNFDERISEKNDFEIVLCEVEDDKNQEYNHEEIVKTGALEMNISELLECDDKENVADMNEGDRDETVVQIAEILNENTDKVSKKSIDDDPDEKISEANDLKSILCKVEHEKNQECNHIEHESETTTDENVAPNDNRENSSNGRSERVAFGNHEKFKNTAKVVKGVSKNAVKEKSTPALVGSHGLKPSRPKSTNPKPFRLRTDERGVLREANLGKKPICPLKDITKSRRFHGDDKLQRKNKYTNQNSEWENDVEEECEQRMLESKTPDDPRGRTIPDSCNNKKVDSEHKLCTMDSQSCVALKREKQSRCHQLELSKERATKKTEENLKRTKLERIQQRVRKPRRVVSTKEEITSLVPSRQHSARKETPLKILSHKDAKKPLDAISRTRRPSPTTPKKPNLHNSHLPTRVAQENWHASY
ncbi:hypothetical protein SDJN03_28627, partial [Cucurbita argyrosperma subsp. sororia]